MERVNAEAEISLSKLNNAHQILSLTDMAVLATDEDGVIHEANANAGSLFGYTPQEMRGMPVHVLVPPHLRQLHADMIHRFVQNDETERPMSQRGEITGYRKDGSFFPLEASIGKFRHGDRWILVATMRDISEQKRKQIDLLWQATHDELTGLPNRNLIHDRLNHALQRSRRQGLSLALLFVDLDGFKLINDTYGHKTGDQLLKIIGNQLIDMVRPGDTIARLSSDEFVILCEQLEQPTAISALAERINYTLRQPIELNGQQLYLSASIGIAVGHGSTHSADDLLRAADTAMNEVKEQGRDNWHFFSASLEEKVRKKLSISNGLRLAIEREELSVRFQPIVDTHGTRIVGAEMLLRWHPEEGPISPALFIPIAEISGSIIPIGGWVLAQACQAEAEWRNRWGEQAPAYISVNVSARQLNEKNLLAEIKAMIKSYACDPSRILLEITETALMADIDTNLRMLRNLADLGFRVAIDDFGTGYSSLAQLTKLPVNVLKIDKAFIDGIEHQPESRAVVKAIIALGRAVGLKLIAEGVENPAQLLELRNFGCDLVQGYLFYRPLEKNQFIAAVEQNLTSDRQPYEPPLFFLLYTSRATSVLDKDHIHALLEQTRLANNSHGITGCLLHQDGYFMQYLEGDKEKVLALLEHIQRDPRHSDVQVITQGSEYHRVFPEWSMGFREIGRELGHIVFPRQCKHRFSLMELAQDPRTSYIYITSFRETGPHYTG